MSEDADYDVVLDTLEVKEHMLVDNPDEFRVDLLTEGE